MTNSRKILIGVLITLTLILGGIAIYISIKLSQTQTPTDTGAAGQGFCTGNVATACTAANRHWEELPIPSTTCAPTDHDGYCACGPNDHYGACVLNTTPTPTATTTSGASCVSYEHPGEGYNGTPGTLRLTNCPAGTLHRYYGTDCPTTQHLISTETQTGGSYTPIPQGGVVEHCEQIDFTSSGGSGGVCKCAPGPTSTPTPTTTLHACGQHCNQGTGLCQTGYTCAFDGSSPLCQTNGLNNQTTYCIPNSFYATSPTCNVPGVNTTDKYIVNPNGPVTQEYILNNICNTPTPTVTETITPTPTDTITPTPTLPNTAVFDDNTDRILFGIMVVLAGIVALKYNGFSRFMKFFVNSDLKFIFAPLDKELQTEFVVKTQNKKFEKETRRHKKKLKGFEKKVEEGMKN